MFDVVLNWYIFLLLYFSRKLGVPNEVIDIWFRWIVIPGAVLTAITVTVWQYHRIQQLKQQLDDAKTQN